MWMARSPHKLSSTGFAPRHAVPLDNVYPLDPTLEDLFLHYARGGGSRS